MTDLYAWQQALTGGATSSLLPSYMIAFLIWSNGFMLATMIAIVVRQKDVAIIKVGLEGQITGARTAVETKVTEAKAEVMSYARQIEGRTETVERTLFAKNGLQNQLEGIGAGVSAMLNLFIRHGEKLGISKEDISDLLEHTSGR